MAKFSVIVNADLEPIIPRYLELRHEELAAMEAALASGDAETVRLLGHRLKGTGTSYGFERFTRLGSAIEATAKAGNLDQAVVLVAEVRDYLENVDISYEERN